MHYDVVQEVEGNCLYSFYNRGFQIGHALK